MFKLPYLTLLVLCFCPVIVFAQDIGDSIEISVRPYAGLRGHLAVYDDGMEVQENASRAGMEAHVKKGSLTFLAGAEFQINMFRAIKSKAYLLWG